MKTRRSSSKRSPPPSPGRPLQALTISSIAADLEDAMLYTCMSADKGESSSAGVQHQQQQQDHHFENDDSSITLNCYKQKTHIPLSPDGSFASLDDSSTTSNTSDSDISLDRSSRPRHAGCQKKQPTKRSALRGGSMNNASARAGDQDGECATISAVSSVANLIFPCSLHLQQQQQEQQEEATAAACATVSASATPTPCEVIANNSNREETTSTTTVSTTESASSSGGSCLMKTQNNKPIPPRLTNIPVPPQQSLLKKSSLKPSSQSTAGSTIASTTSTTNKTPSIIKYTKSSSNANNNNENSNSNSNNDTNAPNTTNNNNANANKKEVQFDSVNVREYNISLSQNPSCSEGPPVELGWSFREPPPIDVQEYETKRQPLRRRCLHDLLLSEPVRRKMLLQSYSPQEITESIRQVEHLKRQRIVTYMMLPASSIDEAAEELYDYMTHMFK